MPVAVKATHTRLMELADLREVEKLHRTALPRGFFVDLGPRFLTAYHRSYLTSPAGIAMVAVADGRLAGFVVGTADKSAHYRHVVRSDRARLSVLGATALVARPALAVRFLRTRVGRYIRGIRRFSRGPAEAPQSPDSAKAVLSHIAVSPEFRRLGLGRSLVDSFADVAGASGASCADVLTRSDNDSARALYEDLGWQLHGEQEDVDGHRWATYRRTLP